MYPYGTKNSSFSLLAVFVTFGYLYVSDVRAFFEKGFFTTSGNTLWDELYEKCGNRVSFYCVQNKLMNYINDTLDSDLRITDGIYFVKTNQNDVDRVFVLNNKFDYGNRSTLQKRRTERTLKTMTTIRDNEIDNSTQPSYQDHGEDEEEFANFVYTVEKIEDDLETKERRENAEFYNFTSTDNVTIEDEPPSDDNIVIKSLNKVTDILYDKTTNYLSSHDLRLHLPQTFFGGSKVVISPRGFDEDGGIMLKLNFSPSETSRSSSFAKYFHKMFKKKLLTSFLALLLIIKLIKIKLMYVLPVIIGVNAAKKLLLKTLLFLFPPLVHLFKLCTYYHAHASKLHFHHHKIKHHHHHIKVPVPVPVPVPSHKPLTHHDLHGVHDEYESVPPVYLEHEPPQVYENPSYGNPEYYTRNDMTNQHGDELASWGLKDFYASTESPGVLSAQAQAFSPYAEQNYKMLQAQASKPFVSIYKDPLKKNKGSNSIGKTKSTNHGSIKNTFLIAYDSFYSPILQKIDSIFTQLGFNEEGCRERLICSMYKNPVRFSPHSNLLSTELSRDPMELEKPSQSSGAAVRFYRYVEAARDGQSQKDCLILYPDCVVKTE